MVARRSAGTVDLVKVKSLELVDELADGEGVGQGASWQRPLLTGRNGSKPFPLRIR